MRLFEINDEIRSTYALLEEYGNEHEGDITEFPLIARLECLEIARDEKLLSLACLYKEIDAEEKTLADQVKYFSERRRIKGNQRERVKAYIQASLNPGEKMEDSQAAISWRKSESVEIEGEASALPEEYKRVKIIEEADKTAIKEAIKSGGTVPGASIITRQNLQIK